MKLLVIRENLKKGLQIVERVTGRSLSLPILNNILLKTEKNYLNLTSTDLEIAISYWLLAKIEREGETVLPGRFFSSLINLLPQEKISLELKNQSLLIESGDYRTQVKTFNPDDFPLLPKVKEGQFFQLNSLSFIEGLNQVIDFCALGSARPEISGVLLVFQKDLVKMVATDSFRLAEKTVFLEKEIEKEASFIVPQKAIRELINILSEKKGKLTIYFSPNQILFEFPFEEIGHPEVQLISRLIDGDYPDYQAIIPKKSETQIILPRLEFLSQLRTAGLFSGKTNEVRLKINPIKKGIEVFSQNPEFGQSQSYLPAKIKGKPTEISFNWKFLAEGLSQIKEPELIFELTDEEGPALLKPLRDLNYLYIAMPIKAG